MRLPEAAGTEVRKLFAGGWACAGAAWACGWPRAAPSRFTFEMRLPARASLGETLGASCWRKREQKALRRAKRFAAPRGKAGKSGAPAAARGRQNFGIKILAAARPPPSAPIMQASARAGVAAPGVGCLAAGAAGLLLVHLLMDAPALALPAAALLAAPPLEPLWIFVITLMCELCRQEGLPECSGGGALLSAWACR